MKAYKTTLAALLLTLGLGAISSSQLFISKAYADDDEGIVIDDEGAKTDSSTASDTSESSDAGAADDSTSYPAGDSDD